MYKVGRFGVYSAIFSALLLQVTVLNHVKIFGAKPDILLISAVFFGLYLGTAAGFETGLAAGILADIFSLDYFGVNAAVFAMTGFAAGAFGSKFFKEARLTQFLLVFSFGVFSMSLHFAYVSAFSKYLILTFPEYLFSSVLPASLYTAVVSVPLFSKFIGIYNLKESEEFL